MSKLYTQVFKELYGGAYDELIKIPKRRARMLVKYHLGIKNIKALHCEYSGCTSIAEAHHPDYDHALEIVWLCKRHHMKLHVHLNKEKKQFMQEHYAWYH